jgi:hypothetical protein
MPDTSNAQRLTPFGFTGSPLLVLRLGHVVEALLPGLLRLRRRARCIPCQHPDLPIIALTSINV